MRRDTATSVAVCILGIITTVAGMVCCGMFDSSLLTLLLIPYLVVGLTAWTVSNDKDARHITKVVAILVFLISLAGWFIAYQQDDGSLAVGGMILLMSVVQVLVWIGGLIMSRKGEPTRW